MVCVTFSSSMKSTVMEVAFICVPSISCPTEMSTEYALILLFHSMFWQKIFLSFSEPRLIRMQPKDGLPSCMLMMGMLCSWEVMAGPFSPPRIASLNDFATLCG